VNPEPAGSDRDKDLKGLIEFEHGSSTALAPFEDDCSILLDEHSTAGLDLLDEFDEKIYFGERTEAEEQEDEAEEPPEKPEEAEPEEPVEEEPSEAEAVVGEEREEGLEEEPSVEEPETALEPANPVIGFVCEHALDLPVLLDAQGRMIGHPIVRLIRLPCAGMVKPSWLELALKKGASGALVVACNPGSCHHRTGACVLEERWNGARRPMLPSRCDRSRLRLFMSHRAAQADLIKEIEGFLAELGELDAPPLSEVAPPEEEQPEEEKPDETHEVTDLPM